MSTAFLSSSLLALAPRTAGSSFFFTFVHFTDHSLISSGALPGFIVSMWVFALLAGTLFSACA